MKKLLILSIILTMAGITYAQKSTIIPTDKGKITITPVLHSSMILQWNNKVIYSDPYGGADLYAGFAAPDLVLITHTHGDHLDPKTLKSLNLSNTELIAPQTVVDKLGDIKFKKVIVLKNGESLTWNGMKVDAVPMYNFDDKEPWHKKGDGNGYVLNMDNKRIYIAGDTEGIPEMRQLKNIDMAFIPMNLPYTMDIEQAADAVIDFKPKVVVPYHFRGKNNVFSNIEQFKDLVNKATDDVEVRFLNWYPENDKK